MRYEPDEDVLKRRLAWLSADPNPHFVLRDSELARADARGLIAISKSILYATHTVIVTEPCSKLEPAGAHPPTASTAWRGNEVSSAAAQYLLEQKGERFAKSFTIIPRSFTTGIEEWEDSEEFLAPEMSLAFNFDDQYTNDLALNVRFTDPVLKVQLLEMSTGTDWTLTPVRLWLPSLEGLDPDTLLRLREDEEDVFVRFQGAVNGLVSGLEGVDSGERLKKVMQQTDLEVRQYKDRMSQIRTRSRRALAGTFVAATAMTCGLVLPEEISRLVVSTLGAFTLKEQFPSLLKPRDDRRELRSGAFYAASRVQEIAEGRDGRHRPKLNWW